MRILEPIVRAVGRLSFRNKLRVTAVIFGIPLLIAVGTLLFSINERVAALQRERAALAVQAPALATLASLHQYLATQLGRQEGDDSLAEPAEARRQAALRAADDFAAALAAQPGLTAAGDGKRLLGDGAELRRHIAEGDAEALAQTVDALRGELEKLNEDTGLLIDGDAASSRLLDIMTSHLPGLVDTNGRAAQLGSVVLVKKSVRGSRRTDLTLQRGNFDALVQWSMDNLQKVTRDHPQLAPELDEAGSRLNAAYLAVQEAITVKMLDTTDFDMTPAAFIDLTGRAFDESLAIAGVLVENADVLLAARLGALEWQRAIVAAAIALGLAVVLACFVAAYISIMRGLNGLSEAVTTMAAGDLSARVVVSSRDELGAVGTQFNQMAESLAQRTAELREKTNDIHGMLQNLTQGILTVVDGGRVHPEYSAYLESIYETREIAGRGALDLLFAGSDLGADARAQIDATIAACLGEDRMNFDFNAHLLAGETTLTLPDGRQKTLELAWSPICDESDTVEKIMVSVRDVTALRRLQAEAEHQKRELAMIGQILQVGQEKFHAFIDAARGFIAANESLLDAAGAMSPALVDQLFRNMHTIKGNARTYGLLHLTNLVHEAEQAYDEFRRHPETPFDKAALLAQLRAVLACVDEYESLNDHKLGRKGPGRRGSAEKYLMVERPEIDRIAAALEAIDAHAARPETLAALLEQTRCDLRLIGTESVRGILDGVFASLPSLAEELGKAPPQLVVEEAGIRLRNQAGDLMRNVFMHLYRNALDHGIEPTAERVAVGKAPAGTIRLTLARIGERLCMRLGDDGRGLALAHIRRKAREKGLLEAGQDIPDEAAARLVFAAGFSTANAVTEVSGRGVGMDAVLDFIRREGGSLDLAFTDAREGADFRAFETVITLPGKFAVDAAPAVAHARHAAPPVAADGDGPAAGLFERVLALPGKLAAAT